MRLNKRSPLVLAVVTAILSSLCCIAPLLAIVAGVSGLASAFSWLEPLRPYQVGVSILVLGVAWYHHLKPARDADCECEDNKSTFLQSRSFLGLVTLGAALMLSFPYYSHIFYSSGVPGDVPVTQEGFTALEFNVSGMTCQSCEDHLRHEVLKLDGIQLVQANYESGKASVQFDEEVVSRAEIVKAIDATGYKVMP